MSLHRFRRTRRALSAVVAVTFTAATLLVCLPVAAAAAEGHCRPQASTEAQDHCARPSAAMDCCENGTQGPILPVVPQGAARVDAGSILVAAAHAELVSLHPGPADAFVLRGAPPHGHRHIDLPTLNSAFLI